MRVKVAEVMARDVPVVEGDTPFKTVAQVLIAADVGAVPVVDAVGRVAGVVTDADLLASTAWSTSSTTWSGRRTTPPPGVTAEGGGSPGVVPA